MIFVDSNIVIDLVERTSRWSAWSRQAMGEAGKTGGFVTNVVVVSECAPRFPTIESELAYIDAIGVAVVDIPHAAAFRAGHAHRAYRRAGGKRESMIADFLIGGHALALGATLLTRDTKRFATYFPDLTLITPEIAT